MLLIERIVVIATIRMHSHAGAWERGELSVLICEICGLYLFANAPIVMLLIGRVVVIAAICMQRY